MILSDLQTYLAKQQRVSLAQLEVKFGIDADALRGMLDRLAHKGRVQKCAMGDRCHGCTSCTETSLEFYQWVDPVPRNAFK